MSIRGGKNGKDHQAPLDEGKPANIKVRELETPEQNLLRFWTWHPTKSDLVDLSTFANGYKSDPKGPGRQGEAFSGRSELIHELAPAIQECWGPLAKKSIAQGINALRKWWRLFDKIESAIPQMPRLTSSAGLSDLHVRAAHDFKVSDTEFNMFVRIANTTRAALGLRQLQWEAPKKRSPRRTLPEPWQSDLIRKTLKHRWFGALDRWDRASSLMARLSMTADELAQQPALSAEEERLLRNYQRYQKAVVDTRQPRPPTSALYGDFTSLVFNKRGFSVMDMQRGWYPDGEDIRVAFHLCLATTGWNPAVLIDLDVEKGFIEVHPKDPNRYVMRGNKDRAGGTEIVTAGHLFKSQGSPGVVIQTLVARTQPLRDILRNQLASLKSEMLELSRRSETTAPLLDKLRIRIVSLEQGVRSPWIYLSTNRTDVQWLENHSFADSPQYRSGGQVWSFLANHIIDINLKQPVDRQVEKITASDLRDAYAEVVYRASGGSIFAVMKALSHRSPSTTVIYLSNSLLHDRRYKVYLRFSNAMLTEMAVRGQVDPTVLAKLSRDGSASHEERLRLTTYREMLRSRIGVGCKSPTTPPRHVAPGFVSDGRSLCTTQRCLLCVENAVIFPDSLDGLCKRFAELLHLRKTIPLVAFNASSFDIEISNTEAALAGFELRGMQERLAHWERKIEAGEHRVVEFNG